jgi:2-iminoacetate synthase ThiH
MKDAKDIVERTRAAIEAGATEMHYYNYGLVPAARLDWVRAAVDAVRV